MASGHPRPVFVRAACDNPHPASAPRPTTLRLQRQSSSAGAQPLRAPTQAAPHSVLQPVTAPERPSDERRSRSPGVVEGGGHRRVGELTNPLHGALGLLLPGQRGLGRPAAEAACAHPPPTVSVKPAARGCVESSPALGAEPGSSRLGGQARSRRPLPPQT